MSVFFHSMQVSGLVAFNVVVGLVVVRGIMNLVAKLTDDEPSIGCVGLPAVVLVVSTSLAAWTLATI